jgi:hypothetical protein
MAAPVKTSISRTVIVKATSIVCPYCDAEAGRDCITTEGGFGAIHIQRVKEAAQINKRKRPHSA